ncbi:hypothetical protein SAMN05216188_102195 [Lentzea xinjiangensis]|uniref:Uncharacterized protein n=1 Tax=Lentzea xinjiangensis TaxID=402600 RepID=A0A1H9DL26_9PSEU|nr:hypothetical protein [Lentzea xinjiangensis]SEQ14119.1 hypothetical protein SAMN05216188_102195 [Lentzea xinjiangensis]
MRNSCIRLIPSPITLPAASMNPPSRPPIAFAIPKTFGMDPMIPPVTLTICDAKVVTRSIAIR